MIARTAAEIAAATGGAVVAGSLSARATGTSIDSRTIAAGDVFFAIRGEAHDGHDHAAEAAAKGASVLVVHRELGADARTAGCTVVRVDDTTRALGALAADERARRGLHVVGVTGSSGKTTTRLLAVEAAGARFVTAGTKGNLNNHWGLPLSILDLPADAEAAVLEMGMNALGEIAALARIARPDVGVITNVGTAHIGLLGSKEAIAAAKAELLEALPEDGTGVVHAGSPELAPHVAAAGCRTIRFGFEEGADLRPINVAGDLIHGASFELDGTRVELTLWGRHAVLNATAALGAALALGIPVAEAAPRLRAVQQPAGRGRVMRLGGGVVLVDEVYNANPSAMEAVLEGLAAAPWPGRRVAVLGDMLELDGYEPEYHRALGRTAARCGITVLHASGRFASFIAEGARDAGLAATVHAGPEEAVAAVPSILRDGDLLLVKGSRGARLETVRDAVAAARGEGR